MVVKERHTGTNSWYLLNVPTRHRRSLSTDNQTLGAGVVEDSVHQGLGGYQDDDEVSVALTAVIVSFGNCAGV